MIPARISGGRQIATKLGKIKEARCHERTTMSGRMQIYEAAIEEEGELRKSLVTITDNPVVHLPEKY